MATFKKNRCAIFSLVVGTVTLIFIFKGVLLLARYGMAVSASTCRSQGHNGTNGSSKDSISEEYVFTITMYGIVSLLRILEYLLLGKQFYVFLFQQSAVDPFAFFSNHSEKVYMALFSIILLPHLLLGFVVPALGIYQELVHTEEITECTQQQHYYQVYMAYCAVNLLRYLSAYSVRIIMILTALSLSKVWSFNPPEPLAYAELSSKKTTVASIEECRLEGTAASDTIEVPNQNSGTHNSQKEKSDDSSSCDTRILQQVLLDWKIVSADFEMRTQQYIATGRKVQVIHELFQNWFVVPWLAYFIASSLEINDVIRPWKADGKSDSKSSEIFQVYYLLYNINQFITLLIPFLCAQVMNTFHRRYHERMRHQQLKQFRDNPSRLSFACQLEAEKDGEYDFMPRIAGTRISIPIGSPFFLIILLGEVLLSVLGTLVHVKKVL